MEFDRMIMVWHRSNETSKRLHYIPGVGPMLATALVASVADPRTFRSGRNFSAWIGLVPKQHSPYNPFLRDRITAAFAELRQMPPVNAIHLGLHLGMPALDQDREHQPAVQSETSRIGFPLGRLARHRPGLARTAHNWAYIAPFGCRPLSQLVCRRASCSRFQSRTAYRPGAGG